MTLSVLTSANISLSVKNVKKKITGSAGEVSLAYKQGESIRVEGGCQANFKGGYIRNS